MVLQRLIITIYILVFSASASHLIAQEVKHDAHAEKIYLQLDNNIYTTDKTIWFKATLVRAAAHDRYITSGVLYVDLIDSDKNILEHKLIKITDGIGDGHFELGRDYEKGIYLIRAYTEWSKNFDKSFMYEKNIIIHPIENKIELNETITNVKYTKDSIETINLQADIAPRVIDIDHKKDVSIIINSDDKIDTIKVSEKNDTYKLNYDLPASVNEVKVKVLTKNKISFETVIYPNKENLDVQFFSESGRLVEGLTNRVAFKAVGYDGKAREIIGSVYCNDTLVTTFKSNVLGMGSFKLNDLKTEYKFKAVINEVGEDKSRTLLLPKIEKEGNIIKVKAVKNTIVVGVFSNYMKNDVITLKASTRGYEYYSEKKKLVDGRCILTIPKTSFPDGIVAFTLYDSNNLPMAERLFFNKNENNRIKGELLLSKSNFIKRDKINVAINMDNKIFKKLESTSILVTNKDLLSSKNENTNILAYLLLSSDLKGKIERPNAYFTKGSDLNVDDLMLTQGWSKYNYIKPKENINYTLEKGLNVKGVINQKKNKKDVDSLELMLISFGDNYSFAQKKVKVPGSFNFELGDLYGKDDEISVQPANVKDQESNNYLIALNRKKDLEVNFEFSSIVPSTVNTINKILDNNKKQRAITSQFYEKNGSVTQLEEVVVNAYKMTPKRKEMLDRFGAPSVVIEGKEIIENSRKWSYGLYSVLLFAFPDKITIKRSLYGGDLRAETTSGGKGHLTLVVVDGIAVNLLNYNLIQKIAIDEVTSFEVIDNPNRWPKFFKEVYPGATQPPPTGSIISIYTKNKIGLFGALGKDDGLKTNRIPVFSKPKEFYVPKYDTDESIDTSIPDQRLPIFWSPEINTNLNGKQEVVFYHDDSIGDFKIILESISKDGKIFYAEKTYTVAE